MSHPFTSKKDLIAAIAQDTGATLKATKDFLDSFERNITCRLAQGVDVPLIGFGTFTSRIAKARKSINPATGAKIQIPEKRKAGFKAGSNLKRSVQGVGLPKPVGVA